MLNNAIKLASIHTDHILSSSPGALTSSLVLYFDSISLRPAKCSIEQRIPVLTRCIVSLHKVLLPRCMVLGASLCCMMRSIVKKCCSLKGCHALLYGEATAGLATSNCCLLLVEQNKPGLAALVAVASCCCGGSVMSACVPLLWWQNHLCRYQHRCKDLLTRGVSHSCM